MADYKDAYDFSWRDKEEKPETSARRITTGSSGFNTGGFIMPPSPVSPKVQHKIAFESEGPTFTVLELTSGLARVPNAGLGSTVKIVSWAEYHDHLGVDDLRPSKNAQVAVVEWEE